MGDDWESFCGSKLDDNPFSTGIPNFSICVQNTFLVWIPAAFTLFLTPILFLQAKRVSKRGYKPLPYSKIWLLKLILSLCLTGINVFVLVHNVIVSTFAADYLYPSLLLVSYASTALSHIVRQRCGMVTSGIQFLSAILFLVFGAFEFYQNIRQGVGNPDGQGRYLSKALYIAYFIYYPLLAIYSILLCFADPRRKGEKSESSPELDSSFLNRLTLWWFNSIPWIGYRKDIGEDDLFEVNEGSRTEFLVKLWDKNWNHRLEKFKVEKAKKKGSISEPSLALTLFCMFKWELLTATFLKFCADTIQFANPYLLHLMISYISEGNSPLWKGLMYAILMFVSSELRSFILSSYFYIMFRLGVKYQTTLTAVVYRKTLTLSNSARRDKTVGEIVNLMAIDVDRFNTIIPYIQQIWSCPYQVTLALIYLCVTLGYSALSGVAILLIFIPMNIVSSYLVKNWQTEQMKLKDERTKLINETLNGMKVIKLYAWEVPMEEYIDSIREKELNLIRKKWLVTNLVDSLVSASPFLVALSSFATFVYSNPANQLTPQVAFVSLTLFNQILLPLDVFVYVINLIVLTVVSNRRLRSFFVAEELNKSIIEPILDEHKISAELTSFDATWEEDIELKQTLRDITIKVPRGDLLAVVGKVGSGKSSLLQAFLGEMGKLRGRIGVHGKLAYVPQQAWIQNMTVRDNILFGRPYNKQLYNKVLYACALVSDLKILPNGDQTEIGEKGINLSGGQKARISLARAVYQNYDVYLLDDPLSAVDAHVGKHIFEKVIGPNGLLKDKTRILVTHGLTYVKHADEIIVLEDGSIAESGNYSELLKSRGKFFQFLEEYKTKGNEEEESSESEEESCTEQELDKSSKHQLKDFFFHSHEQIKSIDESQKLIEEENIEGGGVKLSLYNLYIRAAGYGLVIIFLFLNVVNQGLDLGRSYWLSYWSNLYTKNETNINNGFNLGIYATIGSIETIAYIIALVILVYAGINASRNLHFPLIHNLMRSPMSFFDTTPSGRILNRCAKDIDAIDEILPINFLFLLVCMLRVFFTIVAIIIATPLFAAVIVPLSIIYYMFMKFYVPTARQLRRLASVYRSPIYSHFGETIQGVASIRAFGQVEEFINASAKLVDRFVRVRYMDKIASRWIAVRLELIGNCIIFFAALFAVLAKEFNWVESAETVGVSISYALSVTELLNYAVWHVCEIEANTVAVERINEYTKTPNEAAWDVPEEKPRPDWPQEGVVKFEKYSTRYRAGLDLVLRQISTNVAPGEKIGIVGRTGAGKSSFTLALFRLIEPAEGKITIDGVDVSKIGLHDLRSALTIIPQDPVLFSGTLRFNLDPFEKKEDSEIWQALELAHLKEMASSFEKGLQHHISEGGENISVGQRQLVCLARALLRRTRILVLDEATAAVDVTTDALIQTTIREQFKECTVFTIAHRLNTILDYDRIMVLDKGEIAEFDSPQTLLQNSQSIFSKMVADSKSQDKSD